jgi:hypothetical protein
MFRRNGAGLAGYGSSFADRLGEILERLGEFGRVQETQGRSHVGRGAPVKKQRGVRCQFIPAPFFDDEALDGQVVR